ncbi:TagK domain-containing protein [Cupriavidus campinensis]
MNKAGEARAAEAQAVRTIGRDEPDGKAQAETFELTDLLALAGPKAAGGPALLGASQDRHAVDTDYRPACEDEDVLGVLAIEYREALMCGGQDRARRFKRIEGRRLLGPLPADPLHRSPGTVPAGTLVDDLLGGGRIDKVMKELDTFDAHRLFAPPERHEILGLFSPRRLQGRRNGQLALLARQEHHASSVDSCLTMPDAATEPPKET